ncbi:polymorphic toxin-type HINT domain-containing protein [Deinococcus knuensis]|uniref:polymorphic toxin-type HINT domain-containing protein n=1 Tax=Deinococcus knuensis TaxID=1837380 RepID=UPI001E52EDF5|nr:polymorphic toxin-type HINT domain-containing protein [Deinococcus knuensis]
MDAQPRPAPEGHRDLGKNWVGAGHLKIGDTIKQADGTTGLVANVTTVGQTREMFNLTVSEAHTYYVGQDGWLVHNTSCLTPGAVRAFAKNLPNMSFDDIKAQAEALGFTAKGPTSGPLVGKMLHFYDAKDRMRMRIDPPDGTTLHPHVHLYNIKGDPVDINLKPVKSSSPDAHIPIK